MFLADLPDKSHERKFSEQQIGRALVTTDLLKGQCPWSVSALLTLFRCGVRKRGRGERG